MKGELHLILGPVRSGKSRILEKREGVKIDDIHLLEDVAYWEKYFHKTLLEGHDLHVAALELAPDGTPYMLPYILAQRKSSLLEVATFTETFSFCAKCGKLAQATYRNKEGKLEPRCFKCWTIN